MTASKPSGVTLGDVLELDLGHVFEAPSLLTLDRTRGQPGHDPALEEQHEQHHRHGDDHRGGGDVAVWHGELRDAGERARSPPARSPRSVVEVSEIANTKSFQQMMNTMMNVVTMPGMASGTMTLRNAWNGVAPSTWAACSSSQGISLKNADRM